MEMNTRLQVEHPVTEMVTGIDLVEWQVRIAAGEELTVRQADVELNGHAVEARVYAEVPERNFLPSTGTCDLLGRACPGGRRRPGSGWILPLVEGLELSSSYDPMLSKVIAWGADRAAALDTLDAALAGYTALGVDTNVEYLRLLINDPEVRAGQLDTGLIERKLPDLAFRARGRGRARGRCAHLSGSHCRGRRLSDGNSDEARGRHAAAGGWVHRHRAG